MRPSLLPPRETDPFFRLLRQGRGKQAEASFMSREEIEAVLEEKVSDCPEEILSELAEDLVR